MCNQPLVDCKRICFCNTPISSGHVAGKRIRGQEARGSLVGLITFVGFLLMKKKMMLLLWMKPLVHGTMTLLLDLHCNVHDAPDVEDLYSRNFELLGERLQSWPSAADTCMSRGYAPIPKYCTVGRKAPAVAFCCCSTDSCNYESL